MTATGTISATARGLGRFAPSPRQWTALLIAGWLLWAVVSLPIAPGWAAAAPLALAWAFAGPARPLLAANALGVLFTAYGGAGTLMFLGSPSVDPDTVLAAGLFAGAMAFGVAIGSLSTGRETTTSLLVSTLLHRTLIVAAILVLLFRFKDGIPILLGNEARLQGVANINPYLGLLSGVLPIVASFVVSPSNRFTRVLQFVLVVAVIGTASRLLMLSVIVGFLSSSGFRWETASTKAKLRAVAIVLVGLVAVVQVYSLRTDVEIAQRSASKAQYVGGVAGALNGALGPSIQLAARNGLVVHEIALRDDLHPPHGFLVGGLRNDFRIGQDPERWLSQALGFDLEEVGAVATPIWSGATLDYGLVGSLIVGVIAGFALTLLALRFTVLTLWLAFATVLSFYGSYLVASQFVFSTILLVAVLVFGRRRSI